jgi:hypothetical protein
MLHDHNKQREFIKPNRFSTTQRSQFIVSMSAPTSGDGEGYEIGAVLSWGSRAAPFLSLFGLECDYLTILVNALRCSPFSFRLYQLHVVA